MLKNYKDEEMRREFYTFGLTYSIVRSLEQLKSI